MCFQHFSSWMSANELKLNESKTGLIIIRTKAKIYSTILQVLSLVDVCVEEIPVCQQSKKYKGYQGSGIVQYFKYESVSYPEMRKCHI